MTKRLGLVGLVYFALAFVCAQAFAQANNRLLIPAFQGAKPQGLRALTVELLTNDGFEIHSETPTLTNKASDGTFARTAAKHEVLAVVLAQTTLDKKSWRTSFTVREGLTGKVVGRTELTSTWYPGLQKAYRENLAARLMKLLEQCEPAAIAATSESAASSQGNAKSKSDAKPNSEAKAESTAKSERAAKSKGAAESDTAAGSDSAEETASAAAPDSAPPDDNDDDGIEADNPPNDSPIEAPGLIFSIGPGGSLRNWTINDPLTEANDGPLLSAHSAPAMGLRVALQLFPAAFITQDSIRHIGLDVQFARSLISQTNVANVTADPDDELRDTVMQSYFAGLHIRIPLAPLQLGISAGFGADSITIDGSKEQVAVPDVQAQFLRGALSGRFHFATMTSAQLSVGYRHLLGFGDAPNQLQSPLWFPDTEGTGLDARLEVQHLLAPWFGLSLGGGLTHYALDFNVAPSRVKQAEDADQPPPPIAGGATDLYTTFDLSAVFILGG